MNLIEGFAPSLLHHWKEMPHQARFGNGHLWVCVDDQETEMFYTGEEFPKEDPTSCVLKTAALMATGNLIFGALAGIYIAKMTKEAFWVGRDIYQIWKAGDDKLTTVIQSQLDQFDKSTNFGKKALKFFGVTLLFELSSYKLVSGLTPLLPEFGWYLTMGFAAYAIYHPQYPRVILARIEDWIGEGPIISSRLNWERVNQAKPKKID